MQISLIVAVADNGVIGKKGTMLPWHQAADLKRYKALTIGHPIIMGRTTYESIGHPLPGRQNIVVTHKADYEAPGCTVAHSIDEALQAARASDEIFINGGEAIYEQTLARASKIYLTRIHASPDGDAFFRFNSADWIETELESFPADERNQYPYSFSILTRQ